MASMWYHLPHKIIPNIFDLWVDLRVAMCYKTITATTLKDIMNMIHKE